MLADTYLVFVEIDYLDGDPQQYLVSVGFAFGEQAAAIWDQRPDSILCRVEGDAGSGVVHDAAPSPEFAGALIGLMGDRKPLSGAAGVMRAASTRRPTMPASFDQTEVRSTDNREGHTSIVFGDQFVLKLFRRIEPGINPDLEIRRFLTEQDRLREPAGGLGLVGIPGWR